MVKEEDYTSVPTTIDLENNSNQKKYTINRIPGGKMEISRPLCILLAIGALLLALLVGILVFFLVPRSCNDEGAIKTDNEIDERLPRSVEPLHYRIRLVPDLQNSTISGAVTIHLNVAEETDTILFHVNEITINEQTLSVKPLTGRDPKPIEIKHQQYEEGFKYKVVLKENLKKSTLYQLETKFTGKFNDHLEGLYLTRFNDTFGNEKQIVSSQFGPLDARRVFPCFDEPSAKAKFTISVARPDNMTSLSNMPLATSDISTEKEFTHWDNYDQTPKMSTYAVAIIISNLKPRTIANTSMKIWARDEFSQYTEFAASIAPKILKFFENYFGVEFPLPKIDLVALPELGYDAMENYGLITFREDKLLYDPKSSTGADKRNIALLLAHELANQWIGNLVTPKWWDDLWLKAGFANYLQYKGANHIDYDEEYALHEVRRAMAVDAFESSRPLSSEVKSSRQIRQFDDEIPYAKGGSLIRMMNHFLGEETFKKGLIHFLNLHQDGSADRKDFFAALTDVAPEIDVIPKSETVQKIMTDWTDKPGFPVITAIADYTKNTLRISQKRFYLNGKDEESSWWVPLSFITNKNANFHGSKPKFWLKGEQAITVDATFDNWYILNINQIGYFIVNYDEKNWKSITENIMTIPSLTRAQLISDAMDLARANLLDYEIPLKMIARAVVQDKNSALVPIIAAFSKLQFLSDILSATPAFGNFEAYHEAIFGETYKEIHSDNNVVSPSIKRVFLEWSCRSPVSKCALDFMNRFRNLYAYGQSVDPELSPTVYCVAIRDGGERNWEFTYQRYLYTTSPTEKKTLLDALGCTRLRWLLSKYINKLTDDSGMRSDEAVRVFRAVAKNPVGTTIAFDFLRKNWNELLNRYGDGFNILAKMVKSLVAQMNTEFQLNELERFRDSLKGNASTAAYAFDISIDVVKANIDWMKKNYDHVDKWLTEYKNHFTTL